MAAWENDNVILLTAVASGLLAGLLRAMVRGRRLTSLNLRLLWLVVIAFIPQLLAFNLPATRARLPDQAASAALILSQVMLLVFAWVNRRQPGFWALGVGLALNLLVIAANGGWMPGQSRYSPGVDPLCPSRKLGYRPAPGVWQGYRSACA